MKKIIAFALSLMLVVSCFAFTSCGKELTPYELVSAAVEKSASLKDLELEQTVNMKMDMMGMSVDVPITMAMKGKDVNSDKATFFADMNTTMMGMSVDTVVYIENGYVYLTTLGESYKMPLADVADDYDLAKDLTAVFYCPAESVFEGVEVVKNEDGTSSVSLAMTQEDYIEAYRPYYDSLMGEVGLEGDAKLSDIKVTLTVNKDGYLCGFIMSCGLEMTLTETGMEVPVKATMETEIKFLNIGSDVTITPPEGYQAFPELGADEK